MNEQFFDRDETILSSFASFFFIFSQKAQECFCVILSAQKGLYVQRKMVVPCLTSVVYETPLR